MALCRSFTPCVAPSKFRYRSCNTERYAPSSGTWHRYPFTASLATMSASLHTFPSRHQQLSGDTQRSRAMLSKMGSWKAGLSSAQGMRVLQSAAQDTHPWYPPSSARNQINIGRIFGRIKPSHAPMHRYRDHTLQGRRALVFRQGNADLPASNLVISGAEGSLQLEAWIGRGSQANKRTKSGCERSSDGPP